MKDAPPDDLLPGLLQLAVDAARSASEGILSGFRSARLSTERKPDGSPVTAFDRNAEQDIRAFIARHQPRDWPVLGEELGDNSQRALVGVIHLPALGETYSAARSAGAWCNGQRVQVSQPRPFGECIVSVPAEHHFRLAGIAESEAALRAQAPHLRCFADCWAHAMVARGSIDALAEFRLARWDIAATQVIVEEAGGRALLWEAGYAPGKYDCIIGSPSAAAAVAAVIPQPKIRSA